MIEKSVNVVVGFRTATIAHVLSKVDGYYVYDLLDADGVIALSRYTLIANCPFSLTQGEIDAAVLLGEFTEITQQQPSLADARSAAYKAIDSAAGKTRTKYITDVAGQAETYLIKYDDAFAYKTAGYPSVNINTYPMVHAEGKALYGATPNAAQYQAAADYIITTQAQWITIAADVEQQRRYGKEAIAIAATVTDVLTIQNSTISAIEAL